MRLWNLGADTATDVSGIDTLYFFRSTYSIVSAPAHGVVSGSGANRTFTPAVNYNGPDSFTFRASDGVNESNVATVSIAVDPVNDPPLASDNSAILAEDSLAEQLDVDERHHQRGARGQRGPERGQERPEVHTRGLD